MIFRPISVVKFVFCMRVPVVKIQPPQPGPHLLAVLVYSLLPLAILSLTLLLACWTYHQRKAPYRHVDISQV